MINALICINNYVITCINSMLSMLPRVLQSNEKKNNSPTWGKLGEHLTYIIRTEIEG